MTPPLHLTGSIRKSTKWIKSTRKTRGKAIEGSSVYKGLFRTYEAVPLRVIASAVRKLLVDIFRDLVQKTLALLEPPSQGFDKPFITLTPFLPAPSCGGDSTRSVNRRFSKYRAFFARSGGQPDISTSSSPGGSCMTSPG
jgi:hypothetical protein